MNVLSLFDGIACTKLALNRAGIKVKNYYASEIDKYAMKVAKTNHPNIIHIGDVTQVNWFGLPKIDLLVAGFPCQGFSFAGKQLNFDDPRSKLFFEVVRLIQELEPTYFLLENVVMKKEYEEKISNLIGLKPILINSSLVSAQHRKQLYWTNISNIAQPKDKKLLLKDIIEDGFVDRQKSYAVLPGVHDKSSWNHYHNKRLHQIIKLGNVNPSGVGMNGNVYDVESKAPAITTNKGEGNKIAIIQKSRGYNKGGQFAEKSPTLTSNSWQENNHLTNGLQWRKLTVKECCRLQTVPDNYFDGIVSNNQAYKGLGNGFTVDVIAHILKKIKK